MGIPPGGLYLSAARRLQGDEFRMDAYRESVAPSARRMRLLRAFGIVLVSALASAQPAPPPATEIAQVVTLEEAAQAGIVDLTAKGNLVDVPSGPLSNFTGATPLGVARSGEWGANETRDSSTSSTGLQGEEGAEALTFHSAS